ncbi:hypothetical protein [Olivibacter sitiensis]|nr:hypothetical protein [Olivibacter sitiensis]
MDARKVAHRPISLSEAARWDEVSGGGGLEKSLRQTDSVQFHLATAT